MPIIITRFTNIVFEKWKGEQLSPRSGNDNYTPGTFCKPLGEFGETGDAVCVYTVASDNSFSCTMESLPKPLGQLATLTLFNFVPGGKLINY